MQRHMIRALFAGVAATGAALLTMGLAGAGAAGAATPAAHTGSYPIIYTNSQAGYTVSGRWFRYVATYVKVPPAGSVFNYALVALGGSNVAGVNLGIQAGGGPGSIGWAVGSQPFARAVACCPASIPRSATRCSLTCTTTRPRVA